MDSDWSFHPGIGLGRLKFGMTPEEVQAFEGVYGKVKHEWIQPPRSKEEQKQWEEIMLEGLDPDARARKIEEDRLYQDFMSKNMDHCLESELDIYYYERRLYSISTSRFTEKFNINGLPVYSSEPEVVILALARILKENPVFEENDLVFRKSLVYAFNFTYGVSENGKPLYYTLDGAERRNRDEEDEEYEDEDEEEDDDTDFHKRSIAWGTLPRSLNPEDWSKHVEIKLL